MATLLELLREGKTQELWQRCCGFVDLNIEQFMTIQRQLLLEQIELLKACELGNKLMHGARPGSVEEFRDLVPLTTYADYLPYLAEKQEDALPEKPLLWQRTSGRSSEYSYKWIPFTERMYRELGDIFHGILILASCRERGDIALEEHVKLLYGLAPPPYASGCWGRRASEEHIFDVLPDIDLAEKMDFQERIQAGFQAGLAEGIDMMAAIASVLVGVGERFGQEGISLKRLAALLNKPATLQRLAKAFLKSKIARRPMLPRDIWHLKALISTGTDSFIYREKIKEMWGRYPLDLYGSTEGIIIATQTWDFGTMTYPPKINFLEYVPEAEYHKWSADSSYQPLIFTLNEVNPGEKYATVITNFLGGALVRYVLGDIITITALRHERLNINLPQMTFYGRADDVIDFAAFTHAFFTEVTLWQAIADSGIEYVDWVARKEAFQETPILHLYLEPKGAHIPDEETLTGLVHEQLKRLNKDYQDLETFFGLRPLKVSWLPRGAFRHYMAKKKAEGADLAHLKPRHMNPADSIMEVLLKAVPAETPTPADGTSVKARL
ncbi:MAG: GH3 auxin-responsive promoter family protein [Chloroflexota bacterium]